MESALQAVEGDETLTRRVEEIAVNVDYAKMYELSLDVVGKQKAFERFTERVYEQEIERMHEVNGFTDEFINTEYPQYLGRQKTYLALAVVIPVMVASAIAAVCVVAVKRKRNKTGKQSDDDKQ